MLALKAEECLAMQGKSSWEFCCKSLVRTNKPQFLCNSCMVAATTARTLVPPLFRAPSSPIGPSVRETYTEDNLDFLSSRVAAAAEAGSRG